MRILSDVLTDDRRERVSQVLTWVLAAALLVSIIAVIYIAVTPQPPAEKFTEFYILGPDGKASGYPTNLSVGGEGSVIVGIVNHEAESVTYQVVVAWNNTTTSERRVTLQHDEAWEQRVTIRAPSKPGTYKLRFLLYRADQPDTLYRSLRLWVTVR